MASAKHFLFHPVLHAIWQLNHFISVLCFSTWRMFWSLIYFRVGFESRKYFAYEAFSLLELESPPLQGLLKVPGLGRIKTQHLILYLFLLRNSYLFPVPSLISSGIYYGAWCLQMCVCVVFKTYMLYSLYSVKISHFFLIFS